MIVHRKMWGTQIERPDVAVSAAQAVERLGMPEATDRAGTGSHLCGERTKEQCGLPGSRLSNFPLSESREPSPVPPYLCDAHYKGAGKTWTRHRI